MIRVPQDLIGVIERMNRITKDPLVTLMALMRIKWKKLGFNC